MKKSEIFYQAQLAVLRDSAMINGDKLEIIFALEEQRKVEAFWEDKKEKEAAAEKEAE